MNGPAGTGVAEWLPPPGSDFYYASLYHAPAARLRLCALEALRQEVARIPASCSDRGVAHVKLAWWREEIEHLAEGKARHAISHAVLAHEPTPGALAAVARRFVDAVDDSLLDPVFTTRTAVYEALDAIHGEMLLTMLQPHGATACADRVRRIGALVETAYALCRLREQRRHGVIPLAEEDLAPHGLDREQVREAQHSDQVAAALAPALRALHRALEDAIAELPAARRRELRALITLARIQLRVAALTLDEACPVLERRFELTPVHKLWLAWRTRYFG